MQSLLITLVLAAFAQTAAPAPYPDSQTEPTFSPASVRPKNDIPISAEAEGVLTDLPVREGSRVAKGQVIATIDDRQAQAAVEVAEQSYVAAQERANDKVEEIFALASAAFAKLDLEKDRQANVAAPNAVTDIQLRQKELAYKRAQLQTEKARKDRLIASKEAAVKKAELEASKIMLEHRVIRAPFDGEVQQLFHRQAEWVKPGEPILRLVQFDTLYVECYVNARQFDPIDVQNRRVTVRVNLARDREAAVEGRIVWVNQTVQHDQTYLVRAEVQNRRDGDNWLIRPGLPASMTIHLEQPAAAADPAAEQPVRQ